MNHRVAWIVLICLNTLNGPLSLSMCIPADIVTRCLAFGLGSNERCVHGSITVMTGAE